MAPSSTINAVATAGSSTARAAAFNIADAPPQTAKLFATALSQGGKLGGTGPATGANTASAAPASRRPYHAKCQGFTAPRRPGCQTAKSSAPSQPGSCTVS